MVIFTNITGLVISENENYLGLESTESVAYQPEKEPLLSDGVRKDISSFIAVAILVICLSFTYSKIKEWK